MAEFDLDTRVEFATGKSKRVRDCSREELEAAVALLVKRAVDRARRAGPVTTRRAMMGLSQDQRQLVAYVELFKAVEEEQMAIEEEQIGGDD
jgi:hypothetical protein